MNITAGNPIERAKSLKDTHPKEYLQKLIKQAFSGYVCVCIHGKMGLEEGVMVFHDGWVVSSSYEYFYYNKEYKSTEALERCLNSLLAQVGVIDTFSLSAYQVQLILTLNEESNLPDKIGAENFTLPVNFSFKYEDELRKEMPDEEEITKEEMLKRLGITRLAGEKTTRGELLKKAKEEAGEER